MFHHLSAVFLVMMLKDHNTGFVCKSGTTTDKYGLFLRIGTTSLTQDEIVENCFAVLNSIVTKLPSGLDSILMVGLRGTGMPGLPFYQTLPNPPGKSDDHKGSKDELCTKTETKIRTKDKRPSEKSDNLAQDEEVSEGLRKRFLNVYRAV